MSFVHPGILVAAAGLALAPVLIHLINRRRYQREPWAAMAFLLAAHQTTRRRMHLEQWVLMALRCAVILLLGLTIARPFASGAALVGGLGQPRCDRVIIIDDSLSMQARRGDGRTAFDEAKTRAAVIVDAAGNADGLAVLTASTQGRTWMPQAVHDRQAVRGIIDSLQCSSGMNDLLAALRGAGEILSRGSAADGGRLAYLVTDLTRSSLPATGLATELAGIDRLFVIDVGPDRRNNIALAGLRCASQIIGNAMPIRFAVDVANHGTTPVAIVELEIRLDGVSIRHVSVGPIAPDDTRSHEFDLALSRAGLHRLSAQIVSAADDALGIDDTRYLTIDVADHLSLLLVEGRPSAARTAQELFYFAAAVCPEPSEGQTAFFRGKTVSAGELSDQTLKDYAAVVLGNVPRLAPDAWIRLASYVRDGGGLVMILGDQVQPDGYNALVGAAAVETSLLPFKLRERIGFSPDVEPLHLRIADENHVVLADLKNHEKGGLLMANVRGRWKIDPISPSPAIRTLLSLSNGEPALTVHPLGRGRVVVCTLGLNMADTNLPAKPDYPPLMLNLMAHVAAGEASPGNLLVGEAIKLTPPIGVDAVELTTPDYKVKRLDVSPTAPIDLRATAQSGFYAFKAGSWRADVAVNIDANDSNLARADAAMIRAQFGPKADLIASPGTVIARASFAPSRELATLLGGLLLMGVLSETVLAAWFGRRK